MYSFKTHGGVTDYLVGLAVLLFLQAVAAQTATAQQDIQSMWKTSPHADATSESFVHWNDDGQIPANCATCHSGSGFMDFLGEDGSTAGQTDKNHDTGSLISCDTCHNNSAEKLNQVQFPSGETIENIESSAQCMVCHQGRSSTVAVNKVTDQLAEDTVDPELGFINIHYRAAAATLYGTEVQGGYEYDALEYAGRFEHVAGLNTCTSCHDAHSLKVNASDCTSCHASAGSPVEIRTSVVDFDGDSDSSEGIAAELASIHKALGESIMDYSAKTGNAPVVYGAGKYPYFFNDLNNNRQTEEKESIYPNRYQSWTPRLLRAAYNYQFAAVDTGAYAHNPKYVIQLLYDSLADLAGDDNAVVAAFTRP